ncbi:GH39 family glycosyl hydrolase [Pseudobutyrivibrio sp.]|uniref:GH39 family glycosyl hydrolase n=1 Tax=Pseudobutyrivibrio sp. TaxID=2014367 RepID=UPI001D318378|nr:helix-turn-helix domain-containing protein [Pseudobutyrivibrio sp.]MBE5910284.1 helix-turn-helix domain-containing protein [Pseudobutyrivibrio sp.]
MNSFNQFKVNIYRDMSEAQHLHTDVELLYVVEGVINVKIKDSVFTLERDDVLVINSSIQHSIETVEKSIVCSIMYDYQILVHILKKPNSFFLCNSSVDKTKSYLEIVSLCRDIVYQHVTSLKKTESLMYSMLYKLLDELIEHHMIDDTNAEISENYDADEKLQIIIHYVHTNYQDGISLSDLAKQMYTSTSTLSRLFKKQTGTYFAEYVNQVRTRYAIDELLYTEKNMTKIAMDCGFSNASAFTKVFREIYNMAPTEYRQKMKGSVKKDVVVDEEIKQKIEEEYRHNEEIKSADAAVEAVVDVRNTEELKPCWNKLVNVGFIHDILRANTQYHIQYLAKEIGFTYARIWMVFNTKTMVSDGKTVGDYNFDMIFQALDFLVENRIKPWLDFTNRPYANVTNPEESAWFEDIRINYKDQRVWENLYKQFFINLIRRYGENELSTWRFEIGLEGFHDDYDSFYLEGGYEFVNVFSYISKTLKELVPGAQFGYCGGAGIQEPKDYEQILKSLYSAEYKPDFVSAIVFPYIPKAITDIDGGKANFVRSQDKDFEGHELERIYNMLDKVGIPRNHLVVSEWNLTCSNQNYLNDSCFRGCILLRNIVMFAKDLDIFGLWLASDWQVNSYAARNVINGGGGILSKDTIRKPIYYALKMLNHLGSKVIARGENYMVTKVADDEYQVICFNTVWYNSGYFIDAENQSSVEDAKAYFNTKDNRRFNIKLTGVSENAGYYIKRRSVNREHGSIIDEWSKFDNDSKLERIDIKYLQERCVPELSRIRQKSKGDVLTLDFEMEPQEFCVLHIFPEY